MKILQEQTFARVLVFWYMPLGDSMMEDAIHSHSYSSICERPLVDIKGALQFLLKLHSVNRGIDPKQPTV